MCLTIGDTSSTYEGLDLIISSGSDAGRRFVVTKVNDSWSVTVRRLYWWTRLWRRLKPLVKQVISYMQRWMLYGWLLHVAVCVVVGAVEGICGM